MTVRFLERYGHVTGSHVTPNRHLYISFIFFFFKF